MIALRSNSAYIPSRFLLGQKQYGLNKISEGKNNIIESLLKYSSNLNFLRIFGDVEYEHKNYSSALINY